MQQGKKTGKIRGMMADVAIPVVVLQARRLHRNALIYEWILLPDGQSPLHVLFGCLFPCLVLLHAAAPYTPSLSGQSVSGQNPQALKSHSAPARRPP